MPSKQMRFRVFKRDGFKCAYCGQTPPSVILEVDHVIPKSKNGKDDINNYVTACFDCNRGKGVETLDVIPNTLIDNLERIKEKQEQVQAYNNYLKRLERQTKADIDVIDHIYNGTFNDWCLSDKFKNGSLRLFLSKLPTPKVMQAMALACSVKEGYSDQAIKYFCGICWNWIKNPETRDW